MTTVDIKFQVRQGTPQEFGGAPCIPVDNKGLAKFVLEAVRHVKDCELNPPASAAAPSAFRPRVMLAMLTYCYAIGVYGSKDVEEMMYLDADFRALCGMEYPDWRRLKRFRRENPQVLRRTLEETFKGIWQLQTQMRTQTERLRRSEPENNRAESLEDREPVAPDSEWFSREAQTRIECAMFIDRMAVE